MDDGDAQISFGQWLRRRRKALDLTQVELAGRVPCAKGTIRRIEADDLRPSKPLAERLADVLGVGAQDKPALVRYARSGVVEDIAALGGDQVTPVVTSGAPPHARRHRVPGEPNALIGRQHTTGVAAELLARPDVRLVTLIGPPGVGKTRLGRAVGAHCAHLWRAGACFVELAPLRRPEEVLPAIAQAIELADRGASLAVALAERLRGEELLLILDNVEHVVDAAPALAALLAAAPGLNILCTSRVPLRVAGEHEFVVPPLALPDLTHHAAPGTLEASPAVALFLARARAVHPALAVTDESLRQIAAICHRLDGLPLAIELAANRVKLFTPEALLARLERRLPFLTGGARDAPARQRTLEAAIAWSYDLLHETERHCLARFGVFRGGATLAAVEAICGADLDALPALAALVDHSLVQATDRDTGDVRFTALETIREFAVARLDAEHDAAAVAERHARFYLALAIDGERGLQGADQVRWMARLNAEENNLRAAFAWSLSNQGDVEMGLRAGAGLWWYWWTNGQTGEGRRWLDDLLRRAAEQELAGTSAYGRALLGAGILAFFGGDFAAAIPRFDEARSLGARLRDTITDGYATFMAGSIMILSGQHDDGYRMIDHGSRTLHSAGDEAVWHVGVTSLASSLLLCQRGDLDAAERQAAAGMAVFRRLGQPYGIGLAYNYQGDVARLRGMSARAAECYRAALPLLREANARSEVPAVLHNLANVLMAQGDARQAHALLAEGLELHREIGNRMGVVECLIGMTAALSTLGRPREVATLVGAIEAVLVTLDAPLFAAEEAAYRRAVAMARAQLDEQAWELARQVGRAAPLPEISGMAGAALGKAGGVPPPRETA